MLVRFFAVATVLAVGCLFSGTLVHAAQGEAEPVASASEKPVDLRDVLRWAYMTNPSLQAARAELKAVQEEMPQAMAGWRPLIDADATLSDAKIDGSNYGGSGGDGSTSKEIGLALSQPIYRGGSTVAAVDEARNTIYAQRAILNAAEQQLLFDVATAFMDVLRDQALLDLATNNEAVLERELEATRTRFEVGELTRTDVTQGEARLAEARSTRIRSMGALQSSIAVYERLVGKPAGLLEYPEMNFPIPDTLDKATVFADDHNPSIIASQYIHQSARSNIRQIFGELLPHMSLFGSWDRGYDPQPGILPESTTRTVGITASIPLYEAGGTRSRIRQAKHVANQRFLETIEVKREIRQQTISSWEALRTSVAEIESRKAQVEAAATARQGVKEEADLGSRTVLDVLDADQELLDAKVALVTARRNEIVAEFALAATLGLLTPEVLGFKDFSQEYEDHLERIKWKILGTDVENDGDTP